MKRFRFSGLVERHADGYMATCPELRGCYTEGQTSEETLENVREAIVLHVEDRLACGEEVPTIESVSLTSVEVTV